MHIQHLIAATIVAGVSFAAPAAAATIDTIVLSTEKGAADNKASFTKETPRIYLSARIADIPTGAKITCTWIAVDTQGAAPANYRIDSVELTITDASVNQISTSLSKPNAGWPAGTYEVDLAVDGDVAGKANFSVQ